MVVDTIPCYIKNLNTDVVVTFDVEIPESISDTYSANFTDQITKGRSTPFKAYENSGPRDISFSVLLAADYRRDIIATVNALRNMLKPVQEGYLKYPKCKVRIGSVLNITAVPTSFSATWSNGYIENTYRTCECSFTFSEVEESPTFSVATSNSYNALAITTSGDVGAKASAYNYDEANKNSLGSEFTLTEATNSWSSYEDCYSNNSSTATKLSAGKYYVYSMKNGAYNISNTKTTPGRWVRG